MESAIMITMPIAHYPAHGTSGSLIVVHDIDPDVPCAADAVDMAMASSWVKQSHSSNVNPEIHWFFNMFTIQMAT